MRKKIEFDIPEGIGVPENAEEGDEFVLPATFEIRGDKLCLKAVDGKRLKDEPRMAFDMVADELEAQSDAY